MDLEETKWVEFWKMLERENDSDDVDPVSSPKHYADKEIEVIDYIDDTVPDSYSFYFGNALKYLSRHLKKGKPIEDLEKCRWYIDRMIEDSE
jgi:hypothetical protein